MDLNTSLILAVMHDGQRTAAIPKWHNFALVV